MASQSRRCQSSGAAPQIVKRGDGIKGFAVLPRRWVVERTFSWFGRNRRLAKDYENLALTLAAFVTLACIQITVNDSRDSCLLSQALSESDVDGLACAICGSERHVAENGLQTVYVEARQAGGLPFGSKWTNGSLAGEPSAGRTRMRY